MVEASSSTKNYYQHLIDEIKDIRIKDVQIKKRNIDQELANQLNQDFDLNSTISNKSDLNSTIISKCDSTINQASKLMVLKWSTKDEIIYNLNQLCAFLYGKALEKDGKAKMIKDLNCLISILINLPLNEDAYGENGYILNDLSLIAKDELVLEIEHDTRMIIIENLIKNTFVFTGLIENKMSLIEENYNLINILLNCPVRFAKISIPNDLLIVKKQSDEIKGKYILFFLIFNKL